MKALTIWQPWATLIMAGAKPYEFRGWDYSTRFPSIEGTRIVIHAGCRAVHQAEIDDIRERIAAGESALVGKIALEVLDTSLDRFPLCSGLGTATILRARNARKLFAGVADSDRIDEHLFAWPLQAIEPFKTMQPCRGHQGFWNWPSELEQ